VAIINGHFLQQEQPEREYSNRYTHINIAAVDLIQKYRDFKE